MNCYIDIKLKPDVEMKENLLLNRVFTKYHNALVALASNTIGVSFPEYRLKLGLVLRIHGSRVDLQELQTLDWLGSLKRYCVVCELLEIPETTGFRVISRIQSNMTNSKLRRLIRRNSIPGNQVRQYKAKMYSQGLDQPYLELESASSGHKHRRYIHFGQIVEKPVVGTFDSFGLSKTATVPWF